MAQEPDPAILERRAKREARRERQRQENVLRAQKMHVARVEAEELGEPVGADAARSSELRTEFAGAGPAGSRSVGDAVAAQREFYVGCSGWFYWHWRDTVYPKELPTNQWFRHYAGRFRTVELNAPFYSWPTVATVKSWLRQAARRRFVYTVKVCELITHTKRFEGTHELIRDFGYIADLLGPRMGCFLFQLPPSFHYTPARLDSIVRQLEPCRRNVVEFRHASWWNDEVYERFRESGTIFCSCSAPRLPEALVKTADDIYVRFHGLTGWYRHDYSKEELAAWAQCIDESGARRVWAYFNNDREGYAVRNARTLLKMLKVLNAGDRITSRRARGKAL
jgi:uncharacterized protein YecE (DUF72 family)